MLADLALLPDQLSSPEIARCSVVVIDVLRATTSMAAAIAAGAREIRIFPDIQAARRAADAAGSPVLLCGEINCLPPPGFDLGNSPADFAAIAPGQTLFMSTTNGTRALLAARSAPIVLTGALVNAAAVARQLARIGSDVLLLCAGTSGRPAMEDLLGAGALLAEMRALTAVTSASDLAHVAERLFRADAHDLPGALADSQGGRNVIAAGLQADIDFAARLNALDVVGRLADDPLRIIPTEGPEC